jgi:dTDP-4-amino-4,6-dideoxygalactose transaminase
MMSVPMLDLAAQYRQLREAIDAAVQRVLDSSHFVGGSETAALENELAGFIGVPEVVTVNSGTDALALSLRALGIGAGDEVIVPSFTFFATAEAVSLVGAQCRFADCAPGRHNVDAASLQRALSPRTRAVIVVHLFGEPVDLAPVQKFCADHRLWLIEDAAQAIGAQYRRKNIGTFGDLAAFSFYPTKNLGACGDGGAIACRDPQLAERLRQLRNHGRTARYEHHVVGCNSRLDEIQAAILRAKLPSLNAWNERRRELAASYREGLRDTACRWPVPVESAVPVYHQFVVTHPQRDELRTFLAEQGVATAVFYPIPCHLQPAFAASHKNLALPEAERLAAQVLALPMYPELPLATATRIAALVQLFEQRRSRCRPVPETGEVTVCPA